MLVFVSLAFIFLTLTLLLINFVNLSLLFIAVAPFVIDEDEDEGEAVDGGLMVVTGNVDEGTLDSAAEDGDDDDGDDDDGDDDVGADDDEGDMMSGRADVLASNEKLMGRLSSGKVIAVGSVVVAVLDFLPLDVNDFLFLRLSTDSGISLLLLLNIFSLFLLIVFCCVAAAVDDGSEFVARDGPPVLPFQLAIRSSFGPGGS